ncbi:alpha,alpha-trehalase TreF [Paraflavitalea sp. CAU 1676]|uniref:alpha,alpha-trehalase TreF n=1 Tax=Paraflavitalea sp. CAU 1676 TaxID=3032598 RepID=UPI0023DA8843|nr:alpha,alpha-trehalase TreF [Paraflavitalea sp. CAU 1676]MDF2187010.1 alpha,alpha-trehalase TreF [Paraflavitalea sp. CAU 1676]
MKKTIWLISLVGYVLFATAQLPATPDKIYGELFHQVQMNKVFPDGKTFVDCIPKRAPKDIMYDYGMRKGPQFDLKKFVEENFELPQTPQINYITREKDVVMHIKNLWGVLRREPDFTPGATPAAGPAREGSSLLPLPYPYIVPGGRFREIYYWDSYFTMLGLKESGEHAMIENMVKNFAYLITTYGHIPNGNRTYYLSRSQPPFFALMVELLAEIKGDSTYGQFLPELEKEYQFWMEGSTKLTTGQAARRVVKMKDGSVMNRYWDDSPTPRQESYREDIETAEKSKRNKAEVYTHLRASAESGIDFSSRWFADGKRITTIQTTNYIPVDLNALLYKLEMIIAKGLLVKHSDSLAGVYRKKADQRILSIDKYCWSKSLNYYTDYNFRTAKQSNVVSPAGMYPFCFFTRKLDYMSLLARRSGAVIREKLLKDGGVQTTSNATGEQWDAPNGWAPLTWMTIWGLDRCGQRELAREIGERWIKLNVDVFNRTGKLMEKYNVADTKLEAGGGEYAGQDGFGWTNGVLLKLISKYGLPKVQQ